MESIDGRSPPPPKLVEFLQSGVWRRARPNRRYTNSTGGPAASSSGPCSQNYTQSHSSNVQRSGEQLVQT
eukprot:835199-Pleurochrysis_carterae.AAC.2